MGAVVAAGRAVVGRTVASALVGETVGGTGVAVLVGAGVFVMVGKGVNVGRGVRVVVAVASAMS